MKSLIPTLLGLVLCLPQALLAEDNASAERGRYVLQNGSFLLPAWGPKTWDLVTKSSKPLPAPYQQADQTSAQQAMTRFGLHPAPFDNNNLPMGLRPAWSRDGRTQGLQIDCLLCHGGSIGGKSYVGLGNSTLDMVTFLNAMTRADGKRPPLLTFNLNSERGTVNAGQLAIVLFSLRNADLSMRPVPLALGANLPEQDVPAWWNVAKKSTIYLDGRTPGESARSLMQFYLGELSEDQFAAYEPAFKDILAYIRSLKPPKYPFQIDQAKADAGERRGAEAQPGRAGHHRDRVANHGAENERALEAQIDAPRALGDGLAQRHEDEGGRDADGAAEDGKRDAPKANDGGIAHCRFLSQRSGLNSLKRP